MKIKEKMERRVNTDTRPRSRQTVSILFEYRKKKWEAKKEEERQIDYEHVDFFSFLLLLLTVIIKGRPEKRWQCRIFFFFFPFNSMPI